MSRSKHGLRLVRQRRQPHLHAHTADYEDIKQKRRIAKLCNALMDKRYWKVRRLCLLHMVAHSEQKIWYSIAEDVACRRQPSIFRYKKQRRQHYTPRSSHQQHHDQCGGGAVEERCA
ncbi:hypothetical protein AAG906_013537 [Vitis piasezkii]